MTHPPGFNAKFKVISSKKSWSLNAQKLVFKDGEEGFYYMRGAVVWPQGIHDGFAIVAGYEIFTGSINIFEQYKFTSIFPQERKGVNGCPYIIDGFALTAEKFIKKYGCDKYIYGGPHQDKLHLRHIIEIRNAGLKYRPKFINEPLYAEDEDNVDNMILEHLRLKSLYRPRESTVWWSMGALEDGKVKEAPEYFEDPDNAQFSMAAVQTVRNVVAGFRRDPWRRPKNTPALIDKEDFLRH